MNAKKAYQYQEFLDPSDNETILHGGLSDPCEPHWSPQGQHCVNHNGPCRLEILADLVITLNSCAVVYSFCACGPSNAVGHCVTNYVKSCGANARVCPLQTDYCAVQPVLSSYSYDVDTTVLPQCRTFTAGKSRHE